MKNIFLFFLLQPFLVCSQNQPDTICVTRTELMHYASNAIELKVCKQNAALQNQELIKANNLIDQSKLFIQKQDSAIVEQALLIDECSMQLEREIKRKNRWRTVSYSFIGFFTIYFGIEFLK